MMMLSEREMALKSLAYRKRVLEIIYHAGAGHTGGSLSCVDILNVLYNRVLRVSPETFGDPGRDRYIQSKGHSVEALYVVLADRGFFPDRELETLCGYGSHFVGHPTRKVPGVEQNTGALGHGLSFGVGAALAGKLDRRDYRVFVLLGDGELAEGSNWEAAMSAAHYGLDNLVAIVDHNTLQITGPTKEVCCNEPLGEKFSAFGWEVREVDGHDFGALTEALGRGRGTKARRHEGTKGVEGSRARGGDEPHHTTEGEKTGKPVVVMANTRKGRGISFMENVVKWHHGVPSEEEYRKALLELDEKLAELEGGGV
jgi:transketolase